MRTVIIRWVGLTALAAGLALGALVWAQTGGGFDISWFSADAGGGLIAGDSFHLLGTIGQPEAGEMLMGGEFSLRGGFLVGEGAAGPATGGAGWRLF